MATPVFTDHVEKALGRMEGVLSAPAFSVVNRITQGFETISDEVASIRILDARRGQMLKISRSSNGEVVFTLSGDLDEQHIAELEALIRSEAKGRQIVLDLKHLTLAGRDAVRFLKRCEADNIQLENLPAYIRKWITRERGHN
jgi:hypothetical protein